MNKQQQLSPKISIIVPVYNKQSCIQDCLATILDQSLKEIEIICIDDGSTDSSSEIIQQCQLLDERIILVHQSNQGAGPAKNTGISIAKGEYIAFMDSDDWYPDNLVLEDLYNAACEQNVEICGGSLAECVDGSLRTSYSDERQKYIFKNNELVQYVDYQYDYGFQRFIYRREFLLKNDLKFPAYRRFEDPPFFVRAMTLAGSFWSLSRISYVYRVGGYKTVNWDAEKLEHLSLGLADVINCANANQLTELLSLEVSRINKSYLKLFYKVMNWDICPDGYIISLEALLGALEGLDPSDGSNHVRLELSSLVAGIEAHDTICEILNYECLDEYTPLVSVIVPVYNEEKYLQACVASVQNQAFSQLEIIIVDDGSTDASLRLAKQLMARDQRITVISKTNEGLSSARNAGLAISKGKYVQFLDSDDLLKPFALETLYQKAETEKLDQLFFCTTPFFESYDDLTKHSSFLTYYDYPSLGEGASICLSGQDLFCYLVENNEFKPNACLQFMRKSFLDQNAIKFYPGILHEDNLYTLECLLLSERSAVVPQKLHLRRIHSSSIMTSAQGVRNSYGYYKTVFESIDFVSSRQLMVSSRFEKCFLDRLKVYLCQMGQLYGLSDEDTVSVFMQSLPVKERIIFQALAHCYLDIKGKEEKCAGRLSMVQSELCHLQQEKEKIQSELRKSQIQLNERESELKKTQAAAKSAQLELNGTQAALENSRSELKNSQLEIERLQKELKNAYCDVTKTQASLEKVTSGLAKSQSEIKRLRSSNSWRIGRMITAPIRLVKRLLKDCKK